ncbi:MAG: hypothetical protein AB7O52_01785 [Planctomycetota bacterium]
MFKRFVLLVLGLGSVAGATGCVNVKNRRVLTADSALSARYVGNHFTRLAYDLHDLRVDLDRVIFGLEDTPVEDNP